MNKSDVSRSDVSRRNFLKLIATGSFLGYSTTISAPSHAFGFTAAAIWSGEQIGALTKPIIESGKEWLLQEFGNLAKGNSAVTSKVMIQGFDLINKSLWESESYRFEREISPSQFFCTYSSEFEIGFQSERKRSELREMIYEVTNLDFKYALTRNPILDLQTLSALPFVGIDPNSSPTEKAEVIQYFLHMGFYNSPDELPSLDKVYWHKSVPEELRAKLLQASLTQTTARCLAGAHKFNSSDLKQYLSEEWRQEINSSISKITLLGEAIHLQAGKCRTLLELLESQKGF